MYGCRYLRIITSKGVAGAGGLDETPLYDAWLCFHDVDEGSPFSLGAKRCPVRIGKECSYPGGPFAPEERRAERPFNRPRLLGSQTA